MRSLNNDVAFEWRSFSHKTTLAMQMLRMRNRFVGIPLFHSTVCRSVGTSALQISLRREL